MPAWCWFVAGMVVGAVLMVLSLILVTEYEYRRALRGGKSLR